MILYSIINSSLNFELSLRLGGALEITGLIDGSGMSEGSNKTLE